MVRKIALSIREDSMSPKTAPAYARTSLVSKVRPTGLGRLVAATIFAFALSGCDAPLDTWHEFVVQDWKIPPGTDDGLGTYVIPNRDYLVTAIRAVAPPGTHHITLERTGEVHDVLWVAVVGTGEFVFPRGVGLRLREGEKFYVGYHLFNATSGDLSGTSGIEVIEAEPGAAFEEVNVLNPTIRDRTLPPGPVTESGQCTITEEQTFLAIGPHMHEFGKHLTATLTQGDMEVPLYDAPFNWDAQEFMPLPQMQVHKGDVVNLRCDWYNSTAMPITLGSSATQEMCSAFIYRYPIGNSAHCMY